MVKALSRNTSVHISKYSKGSNEKNGWSEKRKSSLKAISRIVFPFHPFSDIFSYLPTFHPRHASLPHPCFPFLSFERVSAISLFQTCSGSLHQLRPVPITLKTEHNDIRIAIVNNSNVKERKKYNWTNSYKISDNFKP